MSQSYSTCHKGEVASVGHGGEDTSSSPKRRILPREILALGVWRVRAHAEPALQSPLVIPCKHTCKFPMLRPDLSLCHFKDLISHVPNVIVDFSQCCSSIVNCNQLCLQTAFFPNWSQAFGFCFLSHQGPEALFLTGKPELLLQMNSTWETGPHSISQTGRELTAIFLPQPSKCLGS